MEPSHHVTITLQGHPHSAAIDYLKKTSSGSRKGEGGSDLLQNIRKALRGSGTDSVSSAYSPYFGKGEDEPWLERELSWNDHVVILTCGGVIKKQWNLEEEGQIIQYACLAKLEQSTDNASSSATSSAHYSSSNEVEKDESSSQSSFGPFFKAQHANRHECRHLLVVPGVFIFLRSIGKIFLEDGMEYTFSLPFIVRKTWPLHPHGVMIQRVLDPLEIEEAELTGDTPLPTIFSVTSPFSEPASFGLTAGIIDGANGKAASLKDEEEHCTKPLKSISATETVVWVSPRLPNAVEDIVATVDVESRQLSLWRYAYIKPKDTPMPLSRARGRSLSRKRASTNGLLPSDRWHSSFSESVDRDRRLPSSSQETDHLESTHEFPPAFPLRAANVPTASLGMMAGSAAPVSPIAKGRRSSLTPDVEITLTPIEHGRMKAAFWMEKIYSRQVSETEARSWSQFSFSIFDQRFDGTSERSLLAICSPGNGTLVLSLSPDEGKTAIRVKYMTTLAVTSITSIIATRANTWDLLTVKSDHTLSILTHGLFEVPLQLQLPPSDADLGQTHMTPSVLESVAAVKDACLSSVTVMLQGGEIFRTRVCLIPNDQLVNQCLQTLALVLPAELSFNLHHTFLKVWSSERLRAYENTEFLCFVNALYRNFGFRSTPQDISTESGVWHKLSNSSSHDRLSDDRALKGLKFPSPKPTQPHFTPVTRPHPLLALVLYSLHVLAEELRLTVHRYDELLKLVPVICTIAHTVRPEWADYWKRLCPSLMISWPTPTTIATDFLDDRIPVWPPDKIAIFYGRASNPDWTFPAHHMQTFAVTYNIEPSYAYGHLDPLKVLQQVTAAYMCLAENGTGTSTQKRAEKTVENLIETHKLARRASLFLDNLPLGVAAPLREAIRTCQLSPAMHWTSAHYELIGRRDLAFSVSPNAPDTSHNRMFPSPETYMSMRSKKTISELIAQAKTASAGEVDTVSGVELELEDFTDIRFGQDRRLQEAARMLCSSTTSSVRVVERPDLNEHDQAKEQQHQVVRIAERTLALPYGRAMFTFGSALTVTRESYLIPKMEYSVRIQPQSIVASPEAGKIPPDCTNWGEFHNGVAAGLRISPKAKGIESSWIAFNKPSELTPEHAGFLFGLGLTGHLKEMLTWHTFGYLTPKHDLTSIGVLLGLSAANVGTSNRHVTKLLAVHTPALLPVSTVDLNVSLMTQAAGLAGVGLLYLGTKNRRMAEVCLNQICRSDLVQPDLSNEHREAYTYAAALAFGMTMLGQGSSVPADVAFLTRLRLLIHGELSSGRRANSRPSFDVNIASPAASIALGLMYLKTNRQDVADMLEIPTTVLALNRIQPSFLLFRTLARSLIMWDSVNSTMEWLTAQIPEPIFTAMKAHSALAPADDAFELAYYNIIAGACFVIGLKYAGTARHEAYQVIIKHFDALSRYVYAAVFVGPAFDHKIKRSAVREGLNLISIALCMVMAGTGELTCFRRLRYAYGMYHQAFRYGVHVATHMSLGLLFLGGGRFTLGTSNAAIACMVAAFFPRFHHVSSDNKCYLQALRHLWVLAVEPRCLVARDVNTREAVYLPIKVTTKEENESTTAQMISPTLIPDFDNLVSIKVDTPRYWPFFLDVERNPRHRSTLLQSQTLFVKRRTAFLSYTEDPRGSRSLFVRSGSSAGDAATLDFPQLTDTKAHPASDLTHFISSFSNDILFLSFADHFSREDGEIPDERVFHEYCHAALLDSILQDKPETLQSHLLLYQYRTMSPSSRFFHLRLQDLRFAADFYSKVYDRRFSGRSENNFRPPLIRENTVSGALHALDGVLEETANRSEFLPTLARYVSGGTVMQQDTPEEMSRNLAWYLLRHGVPTATLLIVLEELAKDAYNACSVNPPPNGSQDLKALQQGIKQVLHGTGIKMAPTLGTGWSVQSLDKIFEIWGAIDGR
ncbi:hypothetical protein SERLA73DRAFT_114320 [Serpula lacrymans var. lacrymans S7.3]|uniref:Uncharacterized protein n=1 Tax=Serpula lacrymans var. lacrymans (strain S7.3) TaxID=936435 RepID=F8Q9V6_SERL3|nr:hypothetical protein SERLA73DRAFT_114320 [Serpula lacrymans var. lacrymans S7.3]